MYVYVYVCIYIFICQGVNVKKCVLHVCKDTFHTWIIWQTQKTRTAHIQHRYIPWESYLNHIADKRHIISLLSFEACHILNKCITTYINTSTSHFISEFYHVHKYTCISTHIWSARDLSPPSDCSYSNQSTPLAGAIDWRYQGIW
jgi:hypothetical protein